MPFKRPSSAPHPLAFSRKIAFRYLFSKRSEAFITIITVFAVLGVAIGVMVLNMVMAIMTGFEQELRDKIVGANSHVVVRRISGTIDGWKGIAEKLVSIEGVDAVSPFTSTQALLRAGERATGLVVRGIAPGTKGAGQVASYLGDAATIDALFAPPLVGESGAESPLPGIIIGRELAKSHAIVDGDIVSLLSPQVGSSPFGLVPRFRRFQVVGTYASGLIDYEGGLVYVALEEAQRFFRLDDTVTGLEVWVDDIDRAPMVAGEISSIVSALQPGIYAQDWTETNRPLWDAIQLEKRAYFIVLLLIVVMASFSIVGALVMLVLEKRKDIAVMKTIGASSKQIGRIFAIQGKSIGLTGTLLGLALGYAGCVFLREYGFPLDERIFQMSQVPVRIDPKNFLMVGACSYLICRLATLYPARRASKLQPIELLRYE